MTMPNDPSPSPTNEPMQTGVTANAPAPPAPSETAVQAGNPTTAPSPDGTVAPAPPVDEQQEELIGSWLAAHLDKVDVPYQILMLVLAFLLGSFAATNADLWMNFATGRLLAEGEYKFGVDPFSYTTEAKEHQPATPWINHSWLSSWLFYALFEDKNRGDEEAAEAESWSKLVVFKAFLGAGLAALLLWLIPGGAYRWVSVLCVMLAMLTLSPRLILAPPVFSFLFLAVTVFVLVRAGVLAGRSEEARPALLWVLPPLFALWVNMDAWFVLGPLALLVCLAMLGLERYTGENRGPMAGTLAAVLVVGLLACLANPHHVGAITSLPPELAFLLLQVGDFWPEVLISGGRPLVEFHRTNPNFPQTLSPFSNAHITNSAQGLNIGGIAFFVLFVVVLGSFYLVATTPRRPEGPGWSLSRAGLALLFGALALMQVRLIPFFAVIGGAVALLNLHDYLNWRGNLGKQQAEEQTLWGNLARLSIGFLFFGLFFLAWPGWINRSVGDFASTYRVSWAIETDPSIKATTIYLDRMHQDGKLNRCLNFSPEIASYGSWYAPGVKYFFDYRFQLFGTHIAALNRVYLAVQADASQPVPFDRKGKNAERGSQYDWRDILVSYGIDHLAGSGLQSPRPLEGRLLTAAWRDPGEFQPIYTDGKSAVFWWRNHQLAGKLPNLTEEWHQRVFGPVAGYQPPGKLSSLEEDPGFWKLYLWGRRRSSHLTNEADLYLGYFNFSTRDERWRRSHLYARWITDPAISLGVSAGPLVYRGLQWPFLHDERLENGGNFLWSVHPRDVAPPEAPILALRAARLSQVADPQFPGTYKVLAHAIKMQERLEGHWAGDDARVNLRFRLRRLQYVAALKHYLLLNPSDFQAHSTLSETYLQPPFYFLDLSLTHLHEALSALESIKATNLDVYLHEKNRLERLSLQMDKEVSQRVEHFDIISAPETDLQKVNLALYQPYRFQVEARDGKDGKESREGIDRNGLGLVQSAQRILENTRGTHLSEQEAREVVFLRFRLAIETGDLWKVEATLPDFEDKLPPARYLDLVFQLKGALGDVVGADEALEKMEKLDEPANPKDKSPTFRNRVLLGALQKELLPTFGAFVPASAPRWNEVYPLLFQSLENSTLTLAQILLDQADRKLVRGLLAVEAGQPLKARDHFVAALKLAGPLPFADRKIAERYLELLPRGAANK